jgi:hypothetical protein
MNDDFGKGERAPWQDFPAVIANGFIKALSNEPEYNAAKTGDSAAALILVEKLITN